jgi:thioredoxin-like negative regulator of GroEL
MKPVVDRLKQEYEGKVEFQIINVETDQAGAALADEFGVTAVPTFIFVNADGSRAKTLLGTVSESQMTDTLDALK